MGRKVHPSIADIAAALGVSPMSVSYALRGNRHVSPATRLRIVEQAERMGYRPDPLLAHLMTHVRSRRIRNTQAILGLLMFNDDNYTQRLVAGVEARATRLGYAVDKIRIASLPADGRALTRMLQARSIEAVLLTPGRTTHSAAGLLDWSQFASVAMTYSLPEPRLHRVVPHHFNNVLLAVRELRALGYRRPGFVLNDGAELRTNHAYAGALAWAREMGSAVPPHLVTNYDLSTVRTWARRHRADALVFVGYARGEGAFADEISDHKLEKLGLAVMDYGNPHFIGIAGIDQKTQLIGATAVDLLVAQLHRQERGLPANPLVCMVEGEWVNDGNRSK